MQFIYKDRQKNIHQYCRAGRTTHCVPISNINLQDVYCYDNNSCVITFIVIHDGHTPFQLRNDTFRRFCLLENYFATPRYNIVSRMRYNCNGDLMS